jgi:hypothetical protein
MGEQFGVGEKNSGSSDEHKTLDWQHMWKSVEYAGSQAGAAIKKQVEQIDTKDLQEKAKHYGSEGLKVARGHSDNKQANEYSDMAAKFVPGAGLLRKGAEIAHETGADGKVFEGTKGPLHAPSEQTMRGLGSEALGTAIPIPGGGIIGNEVLKQSGVKDRIMDATFDAVKKHGSVEAQNDQKHFADSKQLPKVVLEDKKNASTIDTAKEKVSNFLHGFHITGASTEKKN